MSHRRSLRSVRALLAILLLLLGGSFLTACGSDDDAKGSDTASGTASSSRQLVVSAATSLKTSLTTYGDAFAGGRVRSSFAGSDALAAQIRKGVRPDVFASANTKLPDALFREGLVEKPVVFATNELVLAVPADGRRTVTAVDDLQKAGTTIAIGAEGVPVGDYTRTVLSKLPAAESKAILGNVRSNEPDVGGVVGKIATGAVDAGFVYASDVRGADGKITAIDLPANLEPTVRYGVAIVKGAKNPAGAEAFIDGLLHGAGAAALKAGGFGAPPTQ